MFEHEEEEMHPAAMEQMEDLYPGHAYVREFRFSAPDGNRGYRADIVVLQFDYDALQEWIDATEPARGPPSLFYYEIEDRTPATFESLKEWQLSKLDWSYYETDMASELPALIEQGYVEIEDGVVRTLDFPKNIVQCAIAFELKKVKVDEALEQAERYLDTFANKSYVVIDRERENLALERKEQFRSKGIGLMSLTEDDLRPVIPATGFRRHENTMWHSKSEKMYRMFMDHQLVEADNWPKTGHRRYDEFGYFSR